MSRRGLLVLLLCPAMAGRAYGTTADGQPGEPSSLSGTYYAAVIHKWLDGMK